MEVTGPSQQVSRAFERTCEAFALTTSCSHEDQLGWGSSALQEDVVLWTLRRQICKCKRRYHVPCAIIVWLCDMMLLELLASLPLEDKTV